DRLSQAIRRLALTADQRGAFVKWMRTGGDVAAIGVPAASSAGGNFCARAQATATAPKPWPGSETRLAAMTPRSGRPTRRRTTVPSAIDNVSASRGQGHVQSAAGSPTGRACDPAGPRGRPFGSTAGAWTALVFTPADVVTPPAYSRA